MFPPLGGSGFPPDARALLLADPRHTAAAALSLAAGIGSARRRPECRFTARAGARRLSAIPLRVCADPNRADRVRARLLSEQHNVRRDGRAQPLLHDPALPTASSRRGRFGHIVAPDSPRRRNATGTPSLSRSIRFRTRSCAVDSPVERRSLRNASKRWNSTSSHGSGATTFCSSIHRTSSAAEEMSITSSSR